MKTFLSGLTAVLMLCIVIELGMVVRNQNIMLAAMTTKNVNADKLVAVAQGNSFGPLTYHRLPNGHYNVIRVLNPHDGTAIIRNYLPLGDNDSVATEIPRGMLVEGRSFSIFWERL